MVDIVPCVAELRCGLIISLRVLMRARLVCSVRFLRSINRLCATQLASFCNSPRCLSLSLHNLVVRQRTTHTHSYLLASILVCDLSILAVLLTKVVGESVTFSDAEKSQSVSANSHFD